MKKPLQISLCALMLLLLWDATGLAAPSADAAEISASIHKTDARPTYPAHLPDDYGTPFQAEVIGSSGKNAQAASPEDPQSSPSDDEQHTWALDQPGYHYTSAVGSLLSIRIKKLIFPFHSFL